MGPHAFWLEVAPKDAQSCLVIYPKTMMQDADRKKASIVFESEDMMNTYEHMKANGVTFLEEPQQMQWGTFVRFTDTDGNEFLLKG